MTTDYQCPACGSDQCGIYRHRDADVPYCQDCKLQPGARGQAIVIGLLFLLGPTALLILVGILVGVVV